MFSPAEIYAYSAKFQSIYRLSVSDFTFVRSRIHQDLRPRRDKRGRPPIRVEIIMAAALLYLAHGTTYMNTSIMIRNGLSETSTLRCVRLFTRAVNKRLTPELIKFPTTLAGLERCAHAFELRSGIPNIIGAIDGSHIRVAPPKRHQKSYFNRKSFYSVILSAVVDPRGYFLSCDVGFPGRMSDSKVLRSVYILCMCMPPYPTLVLFRPGTAIYIDMPCSGLDVSGIIFTEMLRTLSDRGSWSDLGTPARKTKKSSTPTGPRRAWW
jgi:hypothetical protein